MALDKETVYWVLASNGADGTSVATLVAAWYPTVAGTAVPLAVRSVKFVL